MEGLLIIPTANAPPSGGPPQPGAVDDTQGEDPFAAVLHDLAEAREGQAEAAPAEASGPGGMAVPYLPQGMLQAPPPLPSREQVRSPGMATAPRDHAARESELIQAEKARAGSPAGAMSRERTTRFMRDGDLLAKGKVDINAELDLMRGSARGEARQPAGPPASAQSASSGRVKVFNAAQALAGSDADPLGEALPADELAFAEGAVQASRGRGARRTIGMDVDRSAAETSRPSAVMSIRAAASETGSGTPAPGRVGLGEKGAPDSARPRRLAAKAIRAGRSRASRGAELTPGAAAGGAMPAVEQTEAAPGSPVERVHTGDLVRQVEGALQRAAHAGRKSVRLRLEPDYLGRVELRVARQGDAMQVTLRAEQASTGALLQRHLGELRQSLSGLGFNMTSVTVEGHGAAMAQHGGWGESRPTPRSAPARRRPKEHAPTPAAEAIRPVRGDSWYVDTQA